MDAFSVSTVNLSLEDPTTGKYLTANVYTVPGVNGGKPISMGGLVMALCLSRASELEASIIKIMDELETNTEKLERLTEIEEKLLNGELLTPTSEVITQEMINTLDRLGYDIYSYSTIGQLYDDLYKEWEMQVPGDPDYAAYNDILDKLYTLSPMESIIKNTPDIVFLKQLGIDPTGKDSTTLITEIESLMDSLNSFSQKTMIRLQSETNKRDQAYDMAANALKGLYTTLTGIVNNL